MDLSRKYPELIAPSSMLFSHPSRVADAWCPFSERVIWSPTVLPGINVRVRIAGSETSELRIRPWTRNPFRRQKRRRRRPLDVAGLVYDARWEAINNVAHLLANIATRLLVARDILREAGHPCDSVTVLVYPRTKSYAKEILRRLSFTVVETDLEVMGDLLVVDKINSTGEQQMHYPIPEVFPEDFSGYRADTPSKVFIARKGTRRLQNAEDVEEALSREGFTAVYFEELSVPEQWSLMRNASEIVGIHGAALSQLLLHRGYRTGRGPLVVEIFSAAHVVRCFEHYVYVQNGSWCAVRSRITPEIVRDMDMRFRPHSHAYDPITVDPKTVLDALQYVRQ